MALDRESDPRFTGPAQFLSDITERIWEGGGVGLIREHYAADCPIRTPHGESLGVDTMIAATLQTLQEFPDRQALPEDIIVGDTPAGFYASHRVRSPATHLGAGGFGAPTGKAITSLSVADSLCRNNRIIREWLVRDQAGMCRQLGLDMAAHGRAMGQARPEAYHDLVDLWRDPAGLTIDGDPDIAQSVLTTYRTIWRDKDFAGVVDGYDRAARREGPGGSVVHGRDRIRHALLSILSALPHGMFDAHHIVVATDPARPVRVSLRWSYHGSHIGPGRYGAPTGLPLSLLAISHLELRSGVILNEWTLLDDLSVHAQIAAHEIGIG